MGMMEEWAIKAYINLIYKLIKRFICHHDF
jgi:hypothetical protein